MKKKILAIILSVLCLTMILPGTVFASVDVISIEDVTVGVDETKTIWAMLGITRLDSTCEVTGHDDCIEVNASLKGTLITIEVTGKKVTDEQECTISVISGGETYAIGTFNVAVAAQITFDADGGTTEPEAQLVKKGEKVIKPVDPVKEGYAFGGWYREDDPYDFNESVVCDMTLTASWTELEKFDVELSQTEFTYKGGEKGQVPEYTVRDKNGDVLEKGTDYTVSVAGGVVSKQINAGDVEIRFIPTENTKDEYKETTATYTIKPAKLQVSLDETEFVYNGEEQNPTVTVTGVGGDVLTEGEDYEVNIGAGVAKKVDVGTYSVSVASFNSNYEGAEAATYTIKPAELKVTLDKTEFTYDGDGHVPEYTVEGVNGKKLEEGKDYHVSIAGGVVSKQVEVGTVEMVFYSDNANYKDATATYEIVAGSNNPKTGDSNNMWLYAAIAALALVAMGGVVLKKKADR